MSEFRRIRTELKNKLTPHPPYDENKDYRASGQCICPECGYEYYLHPEDTAPERLSYDGNPFLIILCNGDRVKL